MCVLCFSPGRVCYVLIPFQILHLSTYFSLFRRSQRNNKSAPDDLRWDNDMSLVRYVTAAPLGPVYTEHQRQCCNDASNAAWIETNGVVLEWCCNPILQQLHCYHPQSLGQGNVFTDVCHSFSPRGEFCMQRGVCI